MKPAPLPMNEAARLDALRRANLLDTPPEIPFDDAVKLAAMVCGAPIALVSFIDERRQWNKAKRGLDTVEHARDISFCAHAIGQHGVLVVPDAREDSRFSKNPLVVGAPHIRFYAGAPLVTAEGFALGAICVMDRVPRQLTDEQIEAIEAIGRQVVAHVEARYRADELARSNRRLETMLKRSSSPSLMEIEGTSDEELPWDRSAEKTLRELTALQRAILESANYAIIACDPNGLIRTFNASATRMSGYTAEEVVGKTTVITLHDRMEVMVRAKELSRELGLPVQPGLEVLFIKPRMGRVDENEWTYIRKDGSRFPLLLSVTALRDDLGSIIGYLGVGRDLTEHKEVDRMKSEFISTVSHELRTPLTSIRGALGLLEGGVVGPLPDEAKEVVQIACENSDRLIRLINELLDLEKMEAGKLPLHVQNIDPAKLVKAALQGIRGMADQAGIRLTGTVEVRGLVRGDWDRLIQVLTNLLSNAIKFSPHGGQVDVRVDRGKSGLRFMVADRGAGIPADQMHKLFRKFQQLDSSDTRQKGGTGLGLAISKALVEHHGGTIGVESNTGEGSVFWFEIPFDEAPESRPRPTWTIPPPRTAQ